MTLCFLHRPTSNTNFCIVLAGSNGDSSRVTSNLIFPQNLMKLRKEVEDKLNCQLSSPNGLIILLLSQQLLLSKQTSALKDLRTEVAELQRILGSVTNVVPSQKAFDQATAYEEYLSLADKSTNCDFRTKMVSCVLV